MKTTKWVPLVVVLAVMLTTLVYWMRPSHSLTPKRNATEEKLSKPVPDSVASIGDEREAQPLDETAMAKKQPSSDAAVNLSWQDSSVDFLSRLDAFRAHVARHDGAVRADCFDYLDSLRGRQVDEQVLFEAGIANEVMGELVRWPGFEPGLSVAFHEMATDPSHLLVIRDYAIQHIASWVTHLRLPQVYSVADPDVVREEADAAWQSLWAIARDGEAQLAGTALVSLQLFADTFAPDETRKFEQALMDLLKDPQLDPGLKASALSLARDFELPELVELARSTTRSGAPSRLLDVVLYPATSSYAAAGHARNGGRTPENFKTQPTSVLP